VRVNEQRRDLVSRKCTRYAVEGIVCRGYLPTSLRITFRSTQSEITLRATEITNCECSVKITSQDGARPALSQIVWKRLCIIVSLCILIVSLCILIVSLCILIVSLCILIVSLCILIVSLCILIVSLCILIVVYVFLLLVYVFLLLVYVFLLLVYVLLSSVYSYFCLCFLIVSLCIHTVVYVFLDAATLTEVFHYPD